jgi:hypothetical protein
MSCVDLHLGLNAATHQAANEDGHDHAHILRVREAVTHRGLNKQCRLEAHDVALDVLQNTFQPALKRGKAPAAQIQRPDCCLSCTARSRGAGEKAVATSAAATAPCTAHWQQSGVIQQHISHLACLRRSRRSGKSLPGACTRESDILLHKL